MTLQVSFFFKKWRRESWPLTQRVGGELGESIRRQGADGNTSIGTQGEEVQGVENYVMRISIIGARHQVLVGTANVGG
jgi:hypothetical protein